MNFKIRDITKTGRTRRTRRQAIQHKTLRGLHRRRLRQVRRVEL